MITVSDTYFGHRLQALTLAHFDCKVSGGRIAFGLEKLEAKFTLASTIVCFCVKVFGRVGVNLKVIWHSFQGQSVTT